MAITPQLNTTAITPSVANSPLYPALVDPSIEEAVISATQVKFLEDHVIIHLDKPNCSKERRQIRARIEQQFSKIDKRTLYLAHNILCLTPQDSKEAWSIIEDLRDSLPIISPEEVQEAEEVRKRQEHCERLWAQSLTRVSAAGLIATFSTRETASSFVNHLRKFNKNHLTLDPTERVFRNLKDEGTKPNINGEKRSILAGKYVYFQLSPAERLKVFVELETRAFSPGVREVGALENVNPSSDSGGGGGEAVASKPTPRAEEDARLGRLQALWAARLTEVRARGIIAFVTTPEGARAVLDHLELRTPHHLTQEASESRALLDLADAGCKPIERGERSLLATQYVYLELPPKERGEVFEGLQELASFRPKRGLGALERGSASSNSGSGGSVEGVAQSFQAPKRARLRVITDPPVTEPTPDEELAAAHALAQLFAEARS